MSRIEYGRTYSVQSAIGRTGFQVKYEADDADTPVVTLKMEDGKSHHLTDVEASELARQLKHALSKLPTSK